MGQRPERKRFLLVDLSCRGAEHDDRDAFQAIIAAHDLKQVVTALPRQIYIQEDEIGLWSCRVFSSFEEKLQR